VRFITDFADQAVMLPLAVAIAGALLAQRWWRGAAAWALAVGGTFGAMLVLKVVFIACTVSGPIDIHTPSGHVAAAAVVAGGFASLLVRHRVTVLFLAALVAVVVAISRLVLGAHSLPEVLVGATVGLGGALGMVWLAGPVPDRLDARRIGLLALLVMAVFHGLHLPAEAQIRGNAWRFAQIFGVCQMDQARP
jgi:membrane-associated phospholipid phosphatase